MNDPLVERGRFTGGPPLDPPDEFDPVAEWINQADESVLGLLRDLSEESLQQIAAEAIECEVAPHDEGRIKDLIVQAEDYEASDEKKIQNLINLREIISGSYRD